MAKQYLTPYQQGIVGRFYAHRETVLSTRLAETVSELYLAEGKAAEKLWKKAADTMLRAGADAADVEKIVGPKDLAGLANIAAELSAAKPATRKSAPKAQPDDF